MRAMEPHSQGCIDRDGVLIHYEVYGEGETTLLFMPAWSIGHSRMWKAQIPYFARRYRVVTFDGRGNGKSDRPKDLAAYHDDCFVEDALEVLGAVGATRAVLIALSRGAHWALMLAAQRPERVQGLALIGPTAACGPFHPWLANLRNNFRREIPEPNGWEKYNAPHWQRNYPDFARFFVSQMFPEPHSTKPIEDGNAWALETDGPTLVRTVLGGGRLTPQDAADIYATVRAPVLVLHGSEDAIAHPDGGARIAELTGGKFVLLEGSGHLPNTRDPVEINRRLQRFFEQVAPLPTRAATSTWTRAPHRRKRRALYLSSPIGLGHARRDMAIASELRRLQPELEIQWLTQSPVTEVLLRAGEKVHPASAQLASESAHLVSESGEHNLHCFYAFRSMDEILVANFMTFQEVVDHERYDLVICDEAWDVDQFWHDNPELKRAEHVFMTDFVGFLPMPSGGDREQALAADYNAEMLERVERYARIRDRAIFVGEPADVIETSFGPGLPSIREWTEKHFEFSGYITGFDPSAIDYEATRAQYGYASNEVVCIVTVGGSGVGEHLLRKVIAALPETRERIPALRMIAVAGPRIAPASLPAAHGLEVRAYVPDLHKHLAVADLAIVQGGLTTTMELVATRRPFLYFPLHDHFEQTFHVAHRLDRHAAGQRMDFLTSTPRSIAAAMEDALRQGTDVYAPVPSDGAACAASMIAELL